MGNRYNVVFETTGLREAKKGIRTWTSYESKEDFQKRYDSERDKGESVIAEGGGEEECIQVCNNSDEEAVRELHRRKGFKENEIDRLIDELFH